MNREQHVFCDREEQEQEQNHEQNHARIHEPRWKAEYYRRAGRGGELGNDGGGGELGDGDGGEVRRWRWRAGRLRWRRGATAMRGCGLSEGERN
ncbi:hypothetical protein HN873_037737 [Arachis hypogaea]